MKYFTSSITTLALLISSFAFAAPAFAQVTSAQWPNTGITHGSQLTRRWLGMEHLEIATNQLRATAVNGERISTWPTDGLPSWIPNAPYVYNNDPNNHGGIVPAGGMLIDGFQVPAGTWVSQFNDFGNDR